MRILADENVAKDVLAWLRASGHDVLFAWDVQAGAPDANWVARAEQEQRLILTADKDFGELVFRDGLSTHGVVLLRLDDLTVLEILARLQTVWSVVEANPSGKFIVVTETKVRVRPMPMVP
jgi:predicted nuclease of predicted toxin-antitoxin system